MKIFAEADLGHHVEALLQEMQRAVRAEDKNQLLNVNEPDYVTYLVSRYRVEPLLLHQEKLYVSTREQMIRAERFPRDFDVRDRAAYSKQVITYHGPFSGDFQLLSLAPSSRILWSMNVEVRNQEIMFDIVNWRDDADGIRREAEETLRNMTRQAASIEREVGIYNSALEQRAAEQVRDRERSCLSRQTFL